MCSIYLFSLFNRWGDRFQHSFVATKSDVVIHILQKCNGACKLSCRKNMNIKYVSFVDIFIDFIWSSSFSIIWKNNPFSILHFTFMLLIPILFWFLLDMEYHRKFFRITWHSGILLQSSNHILKWAFDLLTFFNFHCFEVVFISLLPSSMT